MIERYLAWLTKGLVELPPELAQSCYEIAKHRLIEQPHGDLARWMRVVESLPNIEATLVADQDRISLQANEEYLPQADELASLLKGLHPWRKGPFDIFNVHIDTEWRSDWKWQRVLPHISPLKNRTVLDVGCGSGYHLWRMWAEGAQQVVGIDPGRLFFCQYLVLKRYLESAPVWFVPARMEELPQGTQAFDTVFSMGVLYHRRSPFDHLAELMAALKPGGELVLETLVVDGDENTVLLPEDRYAVMRNVFFLPSTLALERWLRRSGYADVKTVDVTTTKTEEQRSTDWMTFHSLPEFLNPNDSSQTIEGYPAPVRATLVARKPE